MDTSIKTDNEIQAIVPTDLEGSAFHCPAYITKLSPEKHLVYYKIKKLTLNLELNNIDAFLDLNKQYTEMCEFIIAIKKKMHNIRFRNSLNVVCEHFLNNDPQRAWSELKKLSKPSFSSKTLVAIKDKNRKTLISQDDQLNRFAEHYKELASDATSHSLDENY